MVNLRRQLLFSLVVLAAAAALTGVLYLNRPSSGTAPPAARSITVDAARVVMETISIPIRTQGTVSALRQTPIQAEVRGRIVEVSSEFNAGGFMARGDLLLRIDPRDYQTALLRAQAAVESAESNLAQEQGRAQVALREWEKLPPESRQRSPEGKALYLRQPQLEQARAQLLAARADLGTARDNLQRCEIRAPYDALIRAKHTELGQFVSAGTPVADLVSVEQAEVRLPVPQAKLAYLDLPGLEGYGLGYSIDLSAEVAGDRTHWPATLHRTEGVFDERSRVLYLVARVEDPYGRREPTATPLRIGTFVDATIPGKSIPGLVRLPRHILRAGNYLWVIDEELRLRNRRVEVLRAGGREMYVSGGLQSGELVSLTLLDQAFAGEAVQVVSTVPTDRPLSPDQDPPSPEPASPGDAIRVTAERAASPAAEAP